MASSAVWQHMTRFAMTLALTLTSTTFSPLGATAPADPGSKPFVFHYAPANAAECCVFKPELTNLIQGTMRFRHTVLAVKRDAVDDAYRFELDLSGVDDHQEGRFVLDVASSSRMAGQVVFKMVFQCRLDTNAHCPWPGELTIQTAMPLTCGHSAFSRRAMAIPAPKALQLKRLIQGAEGPVKLIGFVDALVSSAKRCR